MLIDDANCRKYVIGHLLNFPLAYVYHWGFRETRDRLRRRTYLVRKRAELLTHRQILNAQYSLAPFAKKLSFAANRTEMNVVNRFANPSVPKSAAINLACSPRRPRPGRFAASSEGHPPASRSGRRLAQTVPVLRSSSARRTDTLDAWESSSPAPVIRQARSPLRHETP
jgi:hypothetical protein